jgi:hypothetical protein
MAQARLGTAGREALNLPVRMVLQRAISVRDLCNKEMRELTIRIIRYGLFIGEGQPHTGRVLHFVTTDPIVLSQQYRFKI